MPRHTLEFEHIVQVNDPANPQVADITRAQLWEGLLLRARCPQRFIEGIDCFAHPQTDSGFVREISAGDAHFYDVGAVHSPMRETTTRLIRVEGANLDHVQRSKIEAA